MGDQDVTVSRRSSSSSIRTRQHQTVSEILGRMPPHERGSMWVWSQPTLEDYFRRHVPPGFDDLIRGLKCFKFASTDIPPITEVRILLQDEIEAWLAEPIPEVDGEKPTAGFRIIQTHQVSMNAFPLSFETYQSIRKEFKLPPVERHQGTREQGASGMFEQEDGSYIIVQRCTHIIGLTSIVLRYDPETNMTEGYLLTDYPMESTHEYMVEYIPNIALQFLECPHPLLIPVLVKEDEFEVIMGKISGNHDTLKNIEVQTGFSHQESVGEDLSNKNNQELVRVLGILNTNYANNLTALNAFTAGARFLNEKVKVLREELPKNRKDEMRRISRVLEDRIYYLQSSLEHGAIWGNMQMRLQAQQGVLFNLINQADTRINIGVAKASRELAAASKQDSSAMKIIAFLTTVFLPGTFLSSFFSMPFFTFDSNPPPNSIAAATTHYLWLYWATTIPLTVFTMTIVIIWAIWRGRKMNSQIRAARRGTRAEKAAEDQADPNAGHLRRQREDSGEKEDGMIQVYVRGGYGDESDDGGRVRRDNESFLTRNGLHQRVSTWVSTRNSFIGREWQPVKPGTVVVAPPGMRKSQEEMMGGNEERDKGLGNLRKLRGVFSGKSRKREVIVLKEEDKVRNRDRGLDVDVEAGKGGT